MEMNLDTALQYLLVFISWLVAGYGMYFLYLVGQHHDNDRGAA